MDLKQEKAERKSVQLALDAVEMGQDPLEEGQEEENRVKKRGRQKLTLPSGITHRTVSYTHLESPSRRISRAPVRETHYARAYMRYGEDFLCFLRSGFPPAPSARTHACARVPVSAPAPHAPRPRPVSYTHLWFS